MSCIQIVPLIRAPDLLFFSAYQCRLFLLASKLTKASGSFFPSLTINLYYMYSCDGVLQHRTLSSGSLNIEDLEDVVKDQLHGRRESITHISSDKVDKVR